MGNPATALQLLEGMSTHLATIESAISNLKELQSSAENNNEVTTLRDTMIRNNKSKNNDSEQRLVVATDMGMGLFKDMPEECVDRVMQFCAFPDLVEISHCSKALQSVASNNCMTLANISNVELGLAVVTSPIIRVDINSNSESEKFLIIGVDGQLPTGQHPHVTIKVVSTLFIIRKNQYNRRAWECLLPGNERELHLHDMIILVDEGTVDIIGILGVTYGKEVPVDSHFWEGASIQGSMEEAKRFATMKHDAEERAAEEVREAERAARERAAAEEERIASEQDFLTGMPSIIGACRKVSALEQILEDKLRFFQAKHLMTDELWEEWGGKIEGIRKRDMKLVFAKFKERVLKRRRTSINEEDDE